jgi:hypothetical protein
MASRPVTIRLPADLYDALKEYARENGKSISDTIFSACEIFLESRIPGFCTFCRTQNIPEALFCHQCGNALEKNSVKSLQEQMDDLKATLDNRIEIMFQQCAVIEKLQNDTMEMAGIKKTEEKK